MMIVFCFDQEDSWSRWPSWCAWCAFCDYAPWEECYVYEKQKKWNRNCPMKCMYDFTNEWMCSGWQVCQVWCLMFVSVVCYNGWIIHGGISYLTVTRHGHEYGVTRIKQWMWNWDRRPVTTRKTTNRQRSRCDSDLPGNKKKLKLQLIPGCDPKHMWWWVLP